MNTEIPDSYRVTEKDCHEAWALFANHDAYLALTNDQIAMVDALIKAGYMKNKSGVWPTLGEVWALIEKEEDAYWQKHFGRNAPRPEELERDAKQKQTA
jgi:hypothetical protein